MRVPKSQMSIFLTASSICIFTQGQFCHQAPGNQLPLHPKYFSEAGRSPRKAGWLISWRGGRTSAHRKGRVLASGPHVYCREGMDRRGDEEMLLVPGGWGEKISQLSSASPSPSTYKHRALYTWYPRGHSSLVSSRLTRAGSCWKIIHPLHSNRSKDWLHALPEANCPRGPPSSVASSGSESEKALYIPLSFIYCLLLASFFKNFLFYIAVEPINNVVIVSGGQQRSSAIHVSVLPQGLPRWLRW